MVMMQVWLLNMGHYLTQCTHIHINNTQCVAFETEKKSKITQERDVNRWPQGLVSKTKVFQ